MNRSTNQPKRQTEDESLDGDVQCIWASTKGLVQSLFRVSTLGR
jgi:hypothetical protein